MTYKTTSEFLKMFGFSTLNDLPELPRYKLDANKQIVIDELVEENTQIEAPSPERENAMRIEENNNEIKNKEV